MATMLEQGCQRGQDEVQRTVSGVVLHRWYRIRALGVRRRLVEDFEPDVIVRHHPHLGPVSRRSPGPRRALTIAISP